MKFCVTGAGRRFDICGAGRVIPKVVTSSEAVVGPAAALAKSLCESNPSATAVACVWDGAVASVLTMKTFAPRGYAVFVPLEEVGAAAKKRSLHVSKREAGLR